MRSIIHILLLIAPAVWAQTQLAPGELAVVRYSSDNPDEISFLLLTSVDSGTVIRMTDNGWTDADTFRTGEGFFEWVAQQDYGCQKVISLDSLLPMRFSTSGDQVLLFQGPLDTPRFITAVNLEGNGVWQQNALSSATSSLPKGLTEGVNAMALWESDNMIYGDSLAGSLSAVSSWVFDANRYKLSDSTISPWDTSFTIGGGCVLPVELLNAHALTREGSTTFKWSTASEWNSAQFTVEHADVGGEFLQVAWHEAAGFSMQIKHYEAEIFEPLRGMWRLRQIDRDGSQQVFGPFALELELNTPVVRYAPGEWIVSLDRACSVWIRSVEGAILDTYETAGELRIEQGRYVPACYLLEIRSERECSTHLVRRLP